MVESRAQFVNIALHVQQNQHAQGTTDQLTAEQLQQMWSDHVGFADFSEFVRERAAGRSIGSSRSGKPAGSSGDDSSKNPLRVTSGSDDKAAPSGRDHDGAKRRKVEGRTDRPSSVAQVLSSSVGSEVAQVLSSSDSLLGESDFWQKLLGRLVV